MIDIFIDLLTMITLPIESSSITHYHIIKIPRILSNSVCDFAFTDTRPTSITGSHPHC